MIKILKIEAAFDKKTHYPVIWFSVDYLAVALPS